MFRGTFGSAFSSCLADGDPEVETVAQDPRSLSGGVGRGRVNVGGYGVDFGAGGIQTGVSYGLGGGGAVKGVLTTQSSVEYPRRWLDLLPYLAWLSTFGRICDALLVCTAHREGNASRSAFDNDGEVASRYGTWAMLPFSQGGVGFAL